MKRLFAILLVAILATSFAFADGNPTITTPANFQVEVIQPLLVVEEGDMTLPDIIKGQTRNWTSTPVVMTFNIEGQELYSIDVTAITTPKAGNPAGTLLLLGPLWSIAPAATITLDAEGEASVTWTCTGANATSASTGTYTFNHEVTAKYTGL